VPVGHWATWQCGRCGEPAQGFKGRGGGASGKRDGVAKGVLIGAATGSILYPLAQGTGGFAGDATNTLQGVGIGVNR
jgi:hypothetical protein